MSSSIRPRSRSFAFALVSAALAAAPRPAEAVTYVFKNVTSQQWSDVNNWSSPEPVFGGGSFDQDILLGDSTNTATGAIFSTPYQIVGSLHFATQGTSFLIGPILRVGGGGSIGDVTGNHQIASILQLNSDGSGGTNLTTATTGFDVAGTLTVSGNLTGNSNISVTGAGSLIFNGANNTYTGSTTIAAGSKVRSAAITGGGALTVDGSFQGSSATYVVGALSGSGALTLSGSTFSFGDATDSSFTGVLTGTSGTFTKNGAGTVSLSNMGGYTGRTIVNNGKLIISDTGGTYSLVGGSGILEFDSAIDDAMTLTTSAAGTLVKSGTSTLTVGGSSVALKAVTINGGTLAATSSGLLNNSVVTNNAVLDLKGSTQSPSQLLGTGELKLGNGNLTLSGGGTLDSLISGAGSFTISGSNELTINTQNTLGGIVNVTGLASLTVNDAFANASVGVNGTLKLNGYNQTFGSLNGGTGTINLGAATLTTNAGTFGGTFTGSGSLTKTSVNTLILTGSGSNNTGLTTISGGTLSVTNPYGDYLNNATLQLTGGVTYTGTISGTGVLLKTGSTTTTLTGPNSYAGGTTISGGRLVVAQPNGAYTDNAALEVSNAQDLTMTSTISGSGSFTKSGAGTLTVSGTMSHAGGTTISAGRYLTAVPFGSYVDNATLEISNALDQTLGSVTGSGLLVKSGTGTLTASTALANTGGIRIDGGTLSAGANGVFSGAIANNATLDLNGFNQTLSQITGSGATKLGAATLTLSGGGTLNSVISGAGSLGITGGSLLTVASQSTYLGSTTIGGPTALSVDNAFPTATSLTVNNTLQLGSASQAVASLAGSGTVDLGTGNLTASTGTFGGTLSGSGTFTKSGAGSLSLTGSLNHTGGTTVNGGRLIVSNPAGNFVNNSELELPNAGTYGGVISGTGSLIKSGVGVLTLTGANSYDGGTTISAGKLVASQPHGNYLNNAALEFSNASDFSSNAGVSGTGSLVKSGAGTLTLTGPMTLTGGTTVSDGRLIVSAPSGIYVDNSILEVSNSTDQSIGAVSGTGQFVKSGAGTLTLNANLGNTGGIRIEGGILKGSTSTLKSDVESLAGTALQLDQTKTAIYEYVFSGAGTLIKSGSKTLILTSAPINTGGVRVSGGSLDIDGEGGFSGGLTVDTGASFVNTSGGTVTVGDRSYVQGEVDTVDGSTTVFTGLVSGAGNFGGFGNVEFDGGYSPGNSPASVTVQGDMTLGSTNDLTMELAGTTLGTGYDHLNVLGNTTLAGNLNVVYYGGFTASLGQTFDLFDFAHATGMFSSITLPTLAHGLAWNTTNLYSNGTITVQAQAVPEPASFAALGLGGLALLRRRRK